MLRAERTAIDALQRLVKTGGGLTSRRIRSYYVPSEARCWTSWIRNQVADLLGAGRRSSRNR
jgi:hypothetical protein